MCDCKPWAEMSEDEREVDAQKLAAQFIGLPGVVGAPLVMGPDYWTDVAHHLVECGVRLCCEPIKHYEVAESLDAKRAAGKWIYDTDEVPETFEEKAQRMAAEQREKFLAAVAAKRAAGELPPEGVSRQQRQAWRVKRAAQAEAAAMDQTIAERTADDTLAGSPVESVAKERKKTTRRKKA